MIKSIFKAYSNRPFLLFLPFLLIYAGFVLAFPTNGLEGDETRYLLYASNLLKGYYSVPGQEVDLSNAPGYPILLMPFLALKLPLITITLLNAVLHYLSVVLVFLVLRKYVIKPVAFSFSIFWALYFNAFQYMTLIYTETLSYFLISLLMFLFMKLTVEGKRYPVANLIASGIVIGWLILVKVIFIYVWLMILLVTMAYWLYRRSNHHIQKILISLSIAFLTILPYLIYTYQLTGRLLYVSTKSDNLYWMSTPHENEYGDWFENLTPKANFNPMINRIFVKASPDRLKLVTEIDSGRMMSPLIRNHGNNYSLFDSLSGIPQDDAFKKAAIANIKAHPKKYAENIFSNMGRMLFSFPYSYTLQKPRTLFRLPMNGILVVLALFCLIPTFLNWRRIPLPIQFMLLFITFYIQLSLLLSAETRMFTVIVPVLLVWIAYMLNKTITFSTRFNS